jgi:hypothetical protein
MALVSPGVEITVIDESQYAPTAVSTIPLLFVATSQNKSSPSGKIAEATAPENVNNLYVLTSQRDVLSFFGSPLFYNNTNNVPLHGYELNEYGLLTAYSLLGVTSRCYVIRADIDLSELASLGDRPLAAPADMTYWLDLTPTRWGLFNWSSGDQAFNTIVPIIITNTDDLSGGAPKNTIGSIGDYAVVTTNDANPVFYKGKDSGGSLVWALVGSDDWRGLIPTVAGIGVPGTSTYPDLSSANTININGTIVTLTDDTVDSLVTDINDANIDGVHAQKVGGKLYLYAISTASSDASTIDGKIRIADDAGDTLDALGIKAGTYASAAVQLSKHTSVPQWKANDSVPRPSNSVWIKTTAFNFGANIAVKRYNALTATWQLLPAVLEPNDWAANKYFDPLRGGSGIPIGTAYVQYDVTAQNYATYKLLVRATNGITIVTGDETNPQFTAGDQLTVSYSVPNSENLTSPTVVTISGTSGQSANPETFVEDILAAGLDYVSAQINADGSVSLIHTAGGVLVLANLNGIPLDDAGITDTSDFCRAYDYVTDLGLGFAPDGTSAGTITYEDITNAIIVSNWVAKEYTASTVSPGLDPDDKTKWYWGEVGEADIMVHDGVSWKGYRNVSVDARGFNLSNTDPKGPIFSTTEPAEQSDKSKLEFGDLWIDTSDLENYPKLYRYSIINDEKKWVAIDVTDQTTENGILFADARFMLDSRSDVVNDVMPTIKEMLTSNYTDIDVPNSLVYPRGMLLFNTRRSSFNVKEFRRNYYSVANFPGEVLPTETNQWVTISGQRENGHAYFGRKAQRNVVVQSLRSAIDTNTEIREEMREFNLVAAPGYPELIPNMIQLNNDRKQTAFVVGDSPMRIPTEGTTLTRWLQNSNLEGVETENSLVTRDPYLGVWYPSVLGSDLAGNLVAMPPSYAVLRMIIRSDQASYPWFAPAGTRRGVLDNVTRLGYLSNEGEFVSVGVRQGIRDILYENNVNPLTFTPVSGIIADGQKTRSSGFSALDRINVARLIVYMRTQLEKAVKPFLFEPNDKLTRDEVKGVVDRFCNDLIAKRALYDYLVVCDESNNTPDRIDRNELYIDIAIEPVKAIEFIYIPIRIKNTGEIASGTNSASRAI